MNIKKIREINGAFHYSISNFSDFRGQLTRIWDSKIFKNLISEFMPVQVNLVEVVGKGTLKGLHFQKFPSIEAKLIICTRGQIFDVMFDSREDSPTFKKWYGITLNSLDRNALFVPANVAHGLQNLENYAQIIYLHGDFYSPEYELGINAMDPDLNIKWPLKPKNMSAKDLALPNYNELNLRK